MTVVALDTTNVQGTVASLVKAAADFSRRGDVELRLFGDEQAIAAILREVAYDPEQLVIVAASHVPPWLSHASSSVGLRQAATSPNEFSLPDVAPVPGESIGVAPPPLAPERLPSSTEVMRALVAPGSSLDLAVNEVAQGGAHALVTTAPALATVEVGLRRLPLLPGVAVPAVTEVFPAKRRDTTADPFLLLLDAGANPTPSVDDYLAYAWMGTIYAGIVSRLEEPRVALLAADPQLHTADDALRRVHARLAREPGLNYVGLVGPREVSSAPADVIVTDGRMGRAVSDLLLGMGDVVTQLSDYAYKDTSLWRMEKRALGRALDQLKRLWDYSGYGGAPVLGFDAILIQADPRGDEAAFANAVKLALRALRHDIPRRLAEGWLARRPPPPTPIAPFAPLSMANSPLRDEDLDA